MLARHDRADTMEWGDLMPDAKGRRSETVLHWLARFFLILAAAALAVYIGLTFLFLDAIGHQPPAP